MVSEQKDPREWSSAFEVCGVQTPAILKMNSNSTRKKQLTDWILRTLRESAWAPLSLFGFYLFGVATDLYDRYPLLDIPTHFLGGAAITYLYRSAIRNSQDFLGEIPTPVQILFAFTCTGTTAILWEFYENIYDYVFGTHIVRGVEDTAVDLFLGLSGALVFSVLYRRP